MQTAEVQKRKIKWEETGKEKNELKSSIKMRGIPEGRREIMTIKDVKANEPELKGRFKTIIEEADPVTDKNNVKYLHTDIS